MQEQQVYDWTLDLFPLVDQPIISLDEAQALVRQVWHFYRCDETAPLVVGVADPQASAGGRPDKITLPLWGQNKAIVLHEIAHSLGDGDHGPQYMKLVIDLYAMFMGTSRAHMMERAAHHKIAVGK